MFFFLSRAREIALLRPSVFRHAGWVEAMTPGLIFSKIANRKTAGFFATCSCKLEKVAAYQPATCGNHPSAESRYQDFYCRTDTVHDSSFKCFALCCFVRLIFLRFFRGCTTTNISSTLFCSMFSFLCLTDCKWHFCFLFMLFRNFVFFCYICCSCWKAPKRNCVDMYVQYMYAN